MPAVSKQQRKFMGLVHAVQQGKVPTSKVSKSARDAAKQMKKSDVEDFADTKEKGLPKKVRESLESDEKTGYLTMMKLRKKDKTAFWQITKSMGSDWGKLVKKAKKKGWTKLKESVKEGDLGLTYKKGKTVKVKHNKSGKEIVIIDKPNIRKEYEKIGFFAEGKVNEVKMSDKQLYNYLLYMRKYKPNVYKHMIKNREIQKLLNKFESINEAPAVYSSPEAKKYLDFDIRKMSKLLGKASQQVIKIMMDGVKGGKYDAMDIPRGIETGELNRTHEGERPFMRMLWRKVRSGFRRYSPKGKLRK